MKFLEEVAKDIHEKTKNSQSFCIILPNNRNILYFREFYSRVVGETVWMPTILTIEKFFSRLTNFKTENRIKLLFELYKLFKKHYKDSKFFSTKNLDDFLPLGEIILDDFNELDNYLVDVGQIYNNIADYQSIDFNEEFLDEEQKRIIREFFGLFKDSKISQSEVLAELARGLPRLYNDFREKLVKNGAVYPGLLRRLIVENKEKIPIEFRKYFFVGFNALTKAERELFKFFKINAEAFFYWDFDEFYLNNINEAGYFLKKNMQLYGDSLNIPRNNFLKKKKINVIAFPQDTLQAKAIPLIFNELNIDFDDEEQLSDTAVVITRDDMLLPVLHSIPDEITKINITTGFSVRYTSFYALVESWLNLIMKTIAKKKVDVDLLLSILKNPLIINEIMVSEELVETLKNLKSNFVSIEFLSGFKEKIFGFLFDKKNFEDINAFLTNFLNFLYYIFWSGQFSENQAIGEFIYALYKNITTLKNQLEDQELDLSLNVIFKFVKELISNIEIPFTGKSTKGLQITTMLETRNLDFKNVIILNLNEDVYPKPRKRPSFISEFIRAGFGLPLIKAQDSVFAYFFYRLLQNAENIYLLYNNNLGENTKEKSRFIQQLEYETNLVEERVYRDPVVPHITKSEKNIPKDEFAKSVLQKYLTGEKYLSASALNTYLDCPAKFYYRYILKIKEPEPRTVQFDAAMFGSLLHKTMEKLYTPYLNKEVKEQDIERLYSQIRTVYNEALSEELKQNPELVQSGVNEFISEIIVKQARMLLDFDKKSAPFKVLGLESKKYEVLETPDGYKLKIIAIFDREDEKDGVIRLIDYKTGSDENTAKLEDLFNKEKVSTHAVFQMALYTYLMRNKPETYEPQLFVIRRISNKAYEPQIKIKIDKTFESLNNKNTELLHAFETGLNDLFREIFVSDELFVFAPSPEACRYCKYKYLCGR